jgi:CPA2 family monovalent cation:H+ antiporter-2
MGHETNLLTLLAAGLVLGFVLGAIALRLRLSPLVGYLVAGMLVGPFTPGFEADASLAMQLGEIGVVLLMFGVGLHFSIEDLREVRRVALPWALFPIAFACALAALVGRWEGWSWSQSAVFGLCLSVASTVVMLRALEDHRIVETRRGKAAIGWLIVEDLVMVLVLVLLPVFGHKAGAPEAVSAAKLAEALGLTFVKLALFTVVVVVVGRRLVPWILRKVAGTGSRELFTLSVLAIALGVAYVSSQWFGVSIALGAFFAGMLLNESELSHKAAADSLPMRDAFAVLFFVSVGMLYDPHILVEQPLLVLATVAIILFGKSAAAYLIMRAFGHSNGNALTISASLAQIGEFAFIIAGLGVALDIMPVQAQHLVLAGALISIMLNPVIFGLLDRWQAGEDAQRHAQDARDAATALAEDAARNRVPDGVTDHAIIVGYGRVGSQLATLLHARGIALVVVEDDADNVARAREAGIPAVRGNAASERVMQEAAPERARLAVFAIPQALEAGESIARLKRLNPAITVLARAHSDAEVRHLLEHGADGAVLAERELAHSLAEMVMATPPYRAR